MSIFQVSIHNPNLLLFHRHLHSLLDIPLHIELLQVEYLILQLRNLTSDHLVLGDQVAVHVLLVDVLLASGVLDEELLEIVQFYL